ncbi:EAL domain-containing protein [Litorivivens sp.]|uniref:EAL domain-containing protein n=1 Tax=Litorivivens sp. TaxID=2020868 RepID=UPI00356A0FB1
MATIDHLRYVDFKGYSRMLFALVADIGRIDVFETENECVFTSDGEFDGVFRGSDYTLRQEIPLRDLDVLPFIGVVAKTGMSPALTVQLETALTNIASNVASELQLRAELDAMAEELGERYDELNLVYKIKHNVESEIDDSKPVDFSLQQLVDDCATFLAVDSAQIIIPGKQCVVQAGKPGRALSEEQLAIAVESMKVMQQSFVSNSEEEAHRFKLDRLGELNVVCAPIFSPNARLQGMFVAVRRRDLAEFTNSDRQLVEIQAEMARKIIKQRYDQVTGLMKQAELDIRFGDVLKSNEQQCCLVFFHFNHLKILADSFGHEHASKLLAAFSSILHDHLDTGCIAARVSADEIVVISTNNDFVQRLDSLFAAIERVNANRHIVPAGSEFSVNVGIVRYHEEFRSAADWLTAGDLAASLAKDNSFQRQHEYSPNDRAQGRRSDDIYWLQNVKSALLNRDFVLYCQPMEALSGGPPHYEVLLRILDDEGNLLSPAKFIEAAERYDLVPNIDQWVVEEICGLLKTYRISEISPESVWSINLSGKSMGSKDFKRFLVELLEANVKFANHQLCFELTETAEIGEMQSALELMKEVKALGAAFSLDDFGCGLSSFSYLKEIPVDYLKIDGSFVQEIESNDINLSMVKAMNSVGKLMGLSTIAEFVESESVKELLQSIGLDYAQGYVVSPPVPLTEVLEQLTEQAGAGVAK